MLLADVRALMPKFDKYNNKPEYRRSGPVLGIALHHSATVGAAGEPLGDAELFFKFQTAEVSEGGYGWEHGAWHYVIRADGMIEYALDESLAGYHAGFAVPDETDPAREKKLKTFNDFEKGQFWNNHYLALCLVGDFSRQDAHGAHPTDEQWYALLLLVGDLRWRYDIPLENIRGHAELMNASGLKDYTDCPGAHFDLDSLRAQCEIETPYLHAEFLHVLDTPGQAAPDTTLALSVVLRNAGNFTWLGPSAILRRIALRCEWFDAQGQNVSIEPRAEAWTYPHEVRPGQTIALNNLALRTPADAGEYTLRLALVPLDDEVWYDTDTSYVDVRMKIEG